METIKHLDLDQISLPSPRPGPLPFPTADTIELAATQGIDVLPRMRVIAKGDGYELVSGILTYRIANVLQQFRVEAEIMSIDPSVAHTLAIMDFKQSSSPLPPLQAGRLYQYLCQTQYMSQSECATRLNVHRREVSRGIRLLSLPAEIIELIDQNKLEVSTARCLHPFPAKEQIELARQAISSKPPWTTGKMEEVCRAKRGGGAAAQRAVSPVTVPVANPIGTPHFKQGWEHIQEQETELSDSIGSPTDVLFNPENHAVEIWITCSNLDVYQGIADRLKGGAIQPQFEDERDFHI